MKVGIAQINTTVGDLSGNSKKIIDAYNELCSRGAELVVFPELVICGYLPRDLLFKTHFIEDNEAALNIITHHIKDVPAIIGFVQQDQAPGTRGIYNAVAWCENEDIKAVSHKCLLPSYDVFDEKRYFTPGTSPGIVSWKGKRIGLTICEDIWTKKIRLRSSSPYFGSYRNSSPGVPRWHHKPLS